MFSWIINRKIFIKCILFYFGVGGRAMSVCCTTVLTSDLSRGTHHWSRDLWSSCLTNILTPQWSADDWPLAFSPASVKGMFTRDVILPRWPQVEILWMGCNQRNITHWSVILCGLWSVTPSPVPLVVPVISWWVVLTSHTHTHTRTHTDTQTHTDQQAKWPGACSGRNISIAIN